MLLLLHINAQAQTPAKYLVLKSGDSIFYQNDLIVDNNQVHRWKFVTADSITYKIQDIRAAYFENNFYYNCNGRSLYKQVVKGKVNVYAKVDRDTITDRNGNLKQAVFIQNATGKPLIYSDKNLIKLIDDPELSYTLRSRNASKNSGKVMTIVGISVGAPLVVGGAFVALLSALFSDNETANTALIVSGAGLALGGGLIGSGIALSSKSKKMSLRTIHLYNSK